MRRRSFLGWLAASPVLAPAAAKALAEAPTANSMTLADKFRIANANDTHDCIFTVLQDAESSYFVGINSALQCDGTITGKMIEPRSVFSTSLKD